MANMHIRTITNGSIDIVCHFPIPAGNNSAGLAWNTAYGRSVGTLATVLPDGDGTLGTITAIEKAAVLNGTVAEVVTQYALPGDWSGLTNTQKAARLSAWYSVQQTSFLARNATNLEWFGLVVT